MVTSTGSGLAVPDWPLSYGSLFPPMVGGVFYEHGHRMIASLVGLFTLCLAIWISIKEQRIWVRKLTWCALGAVIIQGLLGGITVLFFLPTPVSVAHGVLAQTFFVMTIVIAYSQSKGRRQREYIIEIASPAFLKSVLIFTGCVYIQLILGALMRHTHSGLAIYDFPTMAGQWLPTFNETMLANINDWRFEQNLDFVTMQQVVFHFLHRVGALVICLAIVVVNYYGFLYAQDNKGVLKTLIALDALILTQITLGILTVLSFKSPVITSLHVMVGAATLGLSVLLFLKASPIHWKDLTETLFE